MDNGDTDAQVLAYDELHGVLYPSISGIDGGGNAICSAYNIPAYPTHIIIAPNHDIIAQDIWPVSSASDFIDPLEAAGCQANDCGSATLTADFTADVTTLCDTEEVTFSDNSVGAVTTWNWTFEGGDPVTSTDESPIVTYNTAGVYSVTLSVSDGTETADVTLDDYITVDEITAAFVADESDPCDLEQVQFTDNSKCATSWLWTFEGGDPATSTDQNPLVTYNTAGTYSVTLVATNDNGENTLEEASYITVHNCTDIAEYSALEMNITPNPSTGLFKVDFSNQDYYEVYIYDITGHMLHQTTMSNTNNQLDISHLENGVYIINANNGSAQIKQRVIIE